MGPEILVPFGAFATACIMGIGIPIARAYARKLDAQAKNPGVPLEVTSRLERMEQAIEAVAIEIERISEGQRFTTRLLSEGKSAAPASIPPAPARGAPNQS